MLSLFFHQVENRLASHLHQSIQGLALGYPNYLSIYWLFSIRPHEVRSFDDLLGSYVPNG